MFDLEKSIYAWKRSLQKQETFEDGTIADLEIHLRDIIDELKREGRSAEEAFREAAARVGGAEILATECGKVREYRLDRRSPWRPARFMPALLWSYVKIALRKIKRQKLYYLLNISALSLGFACSILAILFIRYEQSYDHYHDNARNIYRIVYKGGPHQGSSWYARTPGLLKTALIQDFSEIVRACRIRPWDVTIRKDNLTFREEKFFLADPEFLEMFSCPLAEGEAGTALTGRYSLLLTEAAAEKYFGRENPVGRTLNVDGQDYRITAVAKNLPQNTHFHFDFLASFETLYALLDAGQIDNWNQSSFVTYVQLRAGTAAAKLTAKLPDFERRWIAKDNRSNYSLQAMTDIHLHGSMNGELETNGDIRYVHFLAAIGMIILIAACLNYINLATARSARSAREVGLRRVIGATRPHIVRQFLGESMVMAAFSVSLSLFLVQLVLPDFNSLGGRDLSLRQIMEPAHLGLLGLLTVFVGLAAGSYPAVYLSSFRPVITLKGAFRQGRRKSRGFRRALVVAQFVISIILISCTLVVHHQLRFIQERPLGFDKNLVVTVPVSDESVNRNPEILRQALLRDPRVSGVAFSSDLPSAIRSSSFAPLGKTEEGKYLSLYTVDVDADFLILYGIKILKGRNFSPRIPSDAQGAKILNEAARKALGPDDPLDKPFALHNYPPGQVIGIVADFHFSPLTQRIEPLAINILPRYEDRFFSIRYASIKIGSGNVSGTLKFIEKTFRTLSPGSPFSYGFLNDQIEAAYVAEKKIAKSLVYFTFLAIAVSCLGLFGLASYVAEQRTKEIGIRKVLGASVPGIVILISQEFLQCVGIAYLLAWPATYFFLRSWLRNFAYRTPLRIDAFVLSAGLSLAIALLTVGGQALRAARTDPVRSLRYE